MFKKIFGNVALSHVTKVNGHMLLYVIKDYKTFLKKIGNDKEAAVQVYTNLIDKCKRMVQK